MRKLLGTLLLALLAIGAVGFFRGWFSISTNSGEEQTKIEVSIDKDRVKQDTDRLKQGVQGLADKMSNGAENEPEEPGTSVLPPDLNGNGSR